MSEFICISCKNKSTFQSVDQLEAHIAESHVSCYPFSCSICEFGGRFSTEAAVVNHIKLCHGIEDEFKFYATFTPETIEKRKKIAELLRRSIETVQAEEQHANDQATHTQTAKSNEENVHQVKVNQNVSKKKISPVDVEKGISQLDTQIITTTTSKPDLDTNSPKPAKIPRIMSSLPQFRPPVVPGPPDIPTISEKPRIEVTEPQQPANNQPTTPILPYVPSIISKVLQGNGSHTSDALPKAIPPVTAPILLGHEKKLSISNGLKRTHHKEKKNPEQPKKHSDTATKGGYNGVNIEHLFTEMDPKTQLNANATDEEHSEGDSASSKEEIIKISKGIPQHDFELPPTFFATKPSSKLGLVLHKAESEGRDFQQKVTRLSVHNQVLFIQNNPQKQNGGRV